MNIKRSIGVAFILALLVIALFPVSAGAAASVYESYTTNDDAYTPIYAYVWEAQTFTVTPESHTVSAVKLRIFRESTPGTVTVSIQAVGDDGKPDGVDLTSATIDGNAISTSTSGVFYVFNFTSAVSLDYDEVYAVVVRAVAGTTDAICIDWRWDATTPTYAGGSRFYSADGGASWTADTAKDFMFEVYGEPLIDVYGAQVFRDFLEDDDMLFVLHYFNVYTPYYSLSDVAQYFDLRLTSSDGATVIAQTVCRAWGDKPGSIYLSADQSAGLTPGSTYRLYIYGVSAESPNDYYQLTTADWRGSDLDYLDSWVVTTANYIADYYGVALTQFVSDKGEILNEEGGVIFEYGIPGLSAIRPDIFVVVMHTPVYEEEDWTDALEESTNYETSVGDDIFDLTTDIGGWWGLTGRDLAAFGIIGVYLTICVVLAIASHGNVGAGIAGVALGIPVIIAGIALGALSPTYLMATVAVAVFLLVYSIWMSRT